MPNATERANARALPETTNRRAVLGAVLVAGAAVALPAMASPVGGPSPLSAADQRVVDLWERHRKLKAISVRLIEQMDAAESQLPAWARCGPKYVLAKGQLPIPDFSSRQVVGWPEVTDLDRQPADYLGWVLARPNIEDLYEQFKKHTGDRDDATGN